MKSDSNFIVMDREEFRPWLLKQNITRTITRLQVHHTWSPAYKDFKDGQEFQRLNAMRNYHMNSNGWKEIGQNITTFPNGLIGVSLGRNINDTPAGIAGANTGALCIENLGNFDFGGDQMSTAQRDTIVYLYAALAEKLHIPIDTSHIVYHAWYTRDGDRLSDYTPGKSSKTCPGTAFFGGNTITAAVKYFLPLIQQQLNAFKGINSAIKEEDQPMTAEEKKAFAALQETVKKQGEQIISLTNSKDTLKQSLQEVQSLAKKLQDNMEQPLQEVPVWAKESVDAAVAAGIINTPEGGTNTFYRLLTVIYRAGGFGGTK